MNRHTLYLSGALTACTLVLCALLVSGCARRDATFATPDDAVRALVTALQNDDLATAAKLLGPGADALLDSGDAVADKSDRKKFVAAYQAKHSLEDAGANGKTLVIGPNDWPMPVPLVQRNGRWSWDGAAGLDELIYRRVGHNELGAIAACRGFVQAQLDYAAEGRDGDPAGIYALKLISDEGMHNGLYWPVAEGEPPSPAGPGVAAAAEEGYRRAATRTPYHGYYYRMLYAQGPHAKGGAHDYFRDGLLTQGFGLVAWPAEYGASGVQTFLVNQDGVVFQKDLGEDTATVVDSIRTFDPDASWQAVGGA